MLMEHGLDLINLRTNHTYPSGYKLVPYIFDAVKSGDLETLKIVMKHEIYNGEQSVI
jgi:hypothetical protein